MGRVTTDSLILSVLIVVFFIIIGLLTLNPLFSALGAAPELMPSIRSYMTIWYVGMVFLVIPMVGNNAMRATGDTISPSLIMVMAAVVNVILDPLLIFGWCGFPRLGLQGAALATVFARALSLVVSISILHFRKRMLSWAVPTLRQFWESMSCMTFGATDWGGGL